MTTVEEASKAANELEAYIEGFTAGLYDRLNAIGELAKELGRDEERARYEALELDRDYQAAQFQRETLRTSELSEMLARAAHWFEYVDAPDSPLSAKFAREIRALLAKPLAALREERPA